MSSKDPPDAHTPCFQILPLLLKGLGQSGGGEQRNLSSFPNLFVLTLLSLNFNLKRKYLLPLFSVSDLPGLEQASSPEASEQGGRGLPPLRRQLSPARVVSAPKPSSAKPGWGCLSHRATLALGGPEIQKPPFTPSWGKGDPTQEPHRPSYKGQPGPCKVCLFPSQRSTQ